MTDTPLAAIDRITQRTAADVAFFDRLAATRAEIKARRGQRCNLAANILRDEMVCALEAWLDPQGMASEKERADAAGKCAARCARDIDQKVGF